MAKLALGWITQQDHKKPSFWAVSLLNNSFTQLASKLSPVVMVVSFLICRDHVATDFRRPLLVQGVKALPSSSP